MENERNLKMLMLHSYLISRCNEHEGFTEEDIYYMRDSSIYSSQISLYKEVIRELSLGQSYEEIMNFIDNYNFNENEFQYHWKWISTPMKKVFNVNGSEFQYQWKWMSISNTVILLQFDCMMTV